MMGTRLNHAIVNLNNTFTGYSNTGTFERRPTNHLALLNQRHQPHYTHLLLIQQLCKGLVVLAASLASRLAVVQQQTRFTPSARIQKSTPMIFQRSSQERLMHTYTLTVTCTQILFMCSWLHRHAANGLLAVVVERLGVFSYSTLAANPLEI